MTGGIPYTDMTRTDLTSAERQQFETAKAVANAHNNALAACESMQVSTVLAANPLHLAPPHPVQTLRYLWLLTWLLPAPTPHSLSLVDLH